MRKLHDRGAAAHNLKALAGGVARKGRRQEGLGGTDSGRAPASAQPAPAGAGGLQRTCLPACGLSASGNSTSIHADQIESLGQAEALLTLRWVLAGRNQAQALVRHAESV